MEKTTFEQMLQAGVHFGHLKRKWNPHMAPYIFTEKKGIHIIDLHKTVVKLDEAAAAMKQIAKSGKKILFVATKKQAKKKRDMTTVVSHDTGSITRFSFTVCARDRFHSIPWCAPHGTGTGRVPAKRFYTSRRLQWSSSHPTAAIHSRFIGSESVKEYLYFDRDQHA